LSVGVGAVVGVGVVVGAGVVGIGIGVTVLGVGVLGVDGVQPTIALPNPQTRAVTANTESNFFTENLPFKKINRGALRSGMTLFVGFDHNGSGLTAPVDLITGVTDLHRRATKSSADNPIRLRLL